MSVAENYLLSENIGNPKSYKKCLGTYIFKKINWFTYKVNIIIKVFRYFLGFDIVAYFFHQSLIFCA